MVSGTLSSEKESGDHAHERTISRPLASFPIASTHNTPPTAFCPLSTFSFRCASHTVSTLQSPSFQTVIQPSASPLMSRPGREKDR